MKQINNIFYVLIIAILLFCSIGMVGQSRKVVSGTVTEMFGNTAEPLVGVNVSIVNNQNRSLGGGVTNINGQYNVVIPDAGEDLTIVFSYIGMKTKRVKYTGQTTLNMTLESEAHSIEQVEVTARRVDRNELGVSEVRQTAATQKINMEELIAYAPVTSIEDALQGQLGGVDIALGGDPGSRSSIRIRGTSTLNASADPLIVIDGVPYPQEIGDLDLSTATEDDLGALLNLSPNDIESVEVLKDASATAIWGVEGANGVLVIKTKQGTVGKTRFSFSSKWTWKEEPNTIPMLNGKEYTSLMQEAIWNSAKYIGLDNPGNKYLDMLSSSNTIGDNPDWKYYDEYNQDVKWLDYVRQDALTSDNNFSMNGGGEKATYRVSLGFMRDDGTTIGTSLDRLNTSMVINYKFSNKLRFGADFSYSQTNKEANWTDNVRGHALSKMPNKSPYTIDDRTGLMTNDYFTYHDPDFEGSFSAGSNYRNAKNYNPVAMVHEAMNKHIEREGRITFRADYEILSGFFYKGLASINMRTSKDRYFLPQVVTGLEKTHEFADRSDDAYSEKMSLQTENKLQYIKDWEDSKHNLVANAIFRTAQHTNSSYSSITHGNASSDLSDPVLGTSIAKMSAGDSESRNVSFVTHVNYSYMLRYVFNVSLNVNGNSSMGRNQRTGYFPSAGLAWNIHEESFMEKLKNTWLEEAKLRFSLGQSGRSPGGTSYLGAYVKGNDYMNMSATKLARMQLDNLKWETSTEYNLGADIALFDGRLKLVADFYWKEVKDLLQKDYELPSSSGFANIKYFNSGKMKNKGYEFRADVVAFQNKDWRIGGYVNFSRNENKITELPGNMAVEPYSSKNGAYATRALVGQPIGAFYGYRYKGVYQNIEETYARDADGNVMNDTKGNPIIMKNLTALCQPGDARYEDINNDGVINQYDIVYLGNSQPTLIGGAGINIKYKQISLNAFFHGRFGQSVINRARMNNEAMYGKENQSTAVLKRWRNEGDDTDIPRALLGEGYNYLGSDRFVEDVSYLRLKQISLNYTFSKKVCQALGIAGLNCFVTGYNLFTWSDYTGQDPEVSTPSQPSKLAEDGASTPIARKYTFGINLSF